MMRFENKVEIGAKAPPIQRICISGILPIHLSPIVIRISSLVIIDKPNIDGKAMNAVNRKIFRKTRVCRSLSSRTVAKTGCATPFKIPVMS